MARAASWPSDRPKLGAPLVLVGPFRRQKRRASRSRSLFAGASPYQFLALQLFDLITPFLQSSDQTVITNQMS
jgi:hypothetical protein